LNAREDLKQGSKKAEKIRRLVRENLDMSWRTMSENYDTWDEIEGTYRIFRPADDEDRDSLSKYGVQKIIVPIQFATLQVMTTFMMEIFTALNPILRLRGADPASVRAARVMELCLDYDYRGNRGYFMLQQWFLNAFRYGFGVMHNSWGSRQIIKKILAPGPSSIFEIDGNEFNVPGAVAYRNQYFTTFEGNEWKLIDNRLFFPDPRMPLSRLQEGIFCGHRNTLHDMDLMEMEEVGLFFNTKDIKDTSFRGITRDSEMGLADHNRDRWRGQQTLENAITQAKRDKVHINEEVIIKIIPKDFELSTEDRPQDWLFNLIDGTTIVRAEPNPFTPRFPYNVIECYPDMLSFMSQGVMEFTQPLAEHLSFLFNSHMANVRKAVKDTLAVDPSRVDIRDILDLKDGGVIRSLPRGYGQDPLSAIKQLPIQDVTAGHMQMAQTIMEMWEKFTGATSHMFGQISTGRRTALELQGVFRQAGARMKMQADLFSSEGFSPLTEQMALLRQENMNIEQYIEVAGQTAMDLGVKPQDIMDGFVLVKKDHISGVFKYPAEEGVLPSDRLQASEILDQTFQTVANAPFLAQVFDPVELFKESVRQKGLRNIDDFLQRGIKAQTGFMTPDQLAELYAKKSIQPLKGGGGNMAGRPDQGISDERATLGVNGAFNGAGASYDGSG
jgi:hypothetical protein